jgi:CSLREA domain-containing protein
MLVTPAITRPDEPQLSAEGEFIALALNLQVNTQDDTNDGTCDANHCSLREAIIAANAAVGADTIIVPAGEYNLTIDGTGEDFSATGDLDTRDDPTINGAGADQTGIHGPANDTVFHIQSSNIVTISGLSIDNGTFGIFVGAGSEVTVNDSYIHHNQRSGIRVSGSPSVDDWLRINRSTIRDNQDRGIYVTYIDLYLDNVTVSNNRAIDFEYGGGI